MQQKRYKRDEDLGYPPKKIAYTIREGMQILRISRATYNRLMIEGRIKTKKVGGRRLVLHTELLRFLAEED